MIKIINSNDARMYAIQKELVFVWYISICLSLIHSNQMGKNYLIKN